MARQGLVRALQLALRPNDASAAAVRQRVAAGLSTSYDVIWPTALPGTQQAFTIDATGNIGWQALAGGGGTVTTLSMPTAIFSVATPSTTPAVTMVNQAANQILAGPSTGVPAAPTFRSLASADIPKTLDNTWITDFVSTVRAQRLDQLTAPTAAVSLNSQKITGLAEPTGAQDAATKGYVDGVAQGLDVKTSVRAASTANITISAPGATIDGVSLNPGDRVLLKNQTSAFQNGIYIFQGPSSPMTRSLDMNVAAEFPNAFFFVQAGTTNADTGWTCTNDTGLTLDTTNVSFTQFNGAGAITAGNGLTQTGNSIDVVGTANRIAVAADSIDISSNYVGQATITTLGTVATGTWNATEIALAKGGTGATTAAGARTNLGVAGQFRGTFTSTSGTNGITVASNVVTLPHNLGQRLCAIVVMDPNGKKVEADDITFTSATSAQLDFSVLGIAAGTWEVLVMG